MVASKGKFVRIFLGNFGVECWAVEKAAVYLARF